MQWFQRNEKMVCCRNIELMGEDTENKARKKEEPSRAMSTQKDLFSVIFFYKELISLVQSSGGSTL
jgi:hypothetical protein